MITYLALSDYTNICRISCYSRRSFLLARISHFSIEIYGKDSKKKKIVLVNKFIKMIFFSFQEISKTPSAYNNFRSYICHPETAFRFPNFPVVFDLEPKTHFSPALLKLLYWPTPTAEWSRTLTTRYIEYKLYVVKLWAI